MMTNPYTTSTQDSPAYKQLLSGRTDDLAQILDHIALGHSVALFGERRIGKTSLLFLLRDIINGHIDQYTSNLIDLTLKNAINELKAKVSPNCTAVYVSLQNVSQPEQAVFANELHQAFCNEGLLHVSLGQDHLLSAQLVSTPPNTTTIMSVFRTLNITPGGRRFVILIDEMEGLQDFVDGKQIARNLRSIIQSSPRICMILAGAEEWHNQIKDKTSPLVRNVHTFYLKAPSHFPVEAYLVEGLLREHLPPSYENSDMIHTIMIWTASKACYVQATCGSIVELYTGKGQIPADWKSTVEDAVFEKTRPILRDFYIGNNLDPLTKNILALLANKPGLIVKQIAVHLGYSVKVISDKMSDLVSLDKVIKQGAEYRIVGTLIEAWGKHNQDIPTVQSSWSQRLKWIAAAVFIIAALLVYSYTHPNVQTFSFTVPDGIVSIQMPSSLEQDEAGTALVSVQNTSAHTITAIHVFLSSSTIDYQQGGTNELTVQGLASGEKKFMKPTYTVNTVGNSGSLTSQVLIIENTLTLTRTVTRTFSLPTRLIPLQKYWLPVSSLLAVLGVFINAKDLRQLLAGLFTLLQRRDT